MAAKVSDNHQTLSGNIHGNMAESMPPELAGRRAGDDDDPSPSSEGSGKKRGFKGFIGTSLPMQRVYDRVEAAARSRAAVFITGETGTGKEICAQAIHQLSPRCNKAFIPLNCAAIPRELMESELFGHVKGAFTGALVSREGAAALADGGTLFLDEITEMPQAMQAKLLRFLQDHTYRKIGGSREESTDVRIICATNRDPRQAVKDGRLREDLYYRLYVLPVHMPALRTRGGDILDIAQTLLRRYAAEEGKNFHRFSGEAEGRLYQYDWPGNIRELQNVIRNLVVMHDGDIVSLPMLPALRNQNDGINQDDASGPADLRPLSVIEREAIERAVTHFNGNIPKAAAVLGVSPSTIYRKRQN